MINDVLIVYQAPWNWDWLWNRSQPLSKALSRKATVIYVDAGSSIATNCVYSLVARLRYFWRYAKYFRRSAGELRSKCEKIGDALFRVTWISPGDDPGYTKVMDRPAASYRPLSKFVGQLARSHKEVWLLTSRPNARLLIDLYPWDMVITDIEDPWLDLSWGQSLDKCMTERLFNQSNIILANGPFLAQEYSALFDAAVVSLSNGVDEQFIDNLERSRSRPSWLVVPEGSRSAVFTGNVNDRIDVEWLLEIVRSSPRIEFFFVGPNALPRSWMVRWGTIADCPNFHHVDQLSHEQIPGVLVHADALLLPYIQNGSSLMFPAKLYEYMAAARPVISTVDYTKAGVSWPLLRYAPDSGAVISALNEIVSGHWRACEQDSRISRQIARANTWERRADEFFWHIKSCSSAPVEAHVA